MLSGKKTIVFDIEANGLWNADTVWCIATTEVSTGESRFFGPNEIKEGLKYLKSADVLMGHNIIEFDIPLLNALYGFKRDDQEVVDTLVLSRLSWPDRTLPVGYTGKGGPHSLEAWGYRMARFKPEHEDWSQFSEEMRHRCSEDVEITLLTYYAIMKEMSDHDWGESISIEHDIQKIMANQAMSGVSFDTELAKEVINELEERIRTVEDQLSEGAPGKYIPAGTVVSKPFLKTGGLTKRARQFLGEDFNPEDLIGPFTPIKFESMNFSSDKQVKEYLLANGWRPISYNFNKDTKERTSPKLEFSEDGDDGISGEIGNLIKEHRFLNHRLSQVKGLLGHVRKDGTIPARANTLGTPTGRMRHSIVVNIPKVSVRYGKEIRSLFKARPGRVMVGRDASQIELRLLAHYMNDKGYIDAILSGDIHTYNQQLAGLPTRDSAKTFIYAFNYGAGDAKLGSIVGGTAEDGAILRERFLQSCPALGVLVKNVQKASRRGYLVSLDGRKITLRTNEKGVPRANAALNALLQGAAAVVMKKAEILLTQWVKEEGLDAIKVIDMHDESQWDVLPEHVERFKELAVQSVVKSGEYFKLNIPLDGEAKSGANWSETH